MLNYCNLFISQNESAISRLPANLSSHSNFVSVKCFSSTPTPQNEKSNKESAETDKSSADGMDLFSRALAAQKKRMEQEQALKKQQQNSSSSNTSQNTTDSTKSSASSSSSSNSSSSSSDPESNAGQNNAKDPDLDEDLSPEEAERRRRWEQAKEKKESEQVAKRSKYGAALFAVGLVILYGYLGLPTKDDKDQEDTFYAHHQRVIKAITSGYKVGFKYL